jgi:hypothetical protein
MPLWRGARGEEQFQVVFRMCFPARQEIRKSEDEEALSRLGFERSLWQLR